jgi:hypothetical protein
MGEDVANMRSQKHEERSNLVFDQIGVQEGYYHG